MRFRLSVNEICVEICKEKEWCFFFFFLEYKVFYAEIIRVGCYFTIYLRTDFILLFCLVMELI